MWSSEILCEFSSTTPLLSLTQHHSISGADGRVVPLSRERLQQLSEEVGVWLSVLNSESEQFSGETQLTRTEGLHSLNTLVCLCVYNMLYKKKIFLEAIIDVM